MKPRDAAPVKGLCSYCFQNLRDSTSRTNRLPLGKWRSFASHHPKRKRGSRGAEAFNLKTLARKPQPKVFHYESTAENLGKAGAPTLLYQSNSNRGYIMGCYFTAAALVGMGLFNWHSINLVPDDKGEGKNSRKLPNWVPIFATTGCVLLIATGGYFLIKPHNLITSIKAVPRDLSTRTDAIQLQIQRSQAVPFVKPSTIQVDPVDITLSSRIWQGKNEQIKREMAQMDSQRARNYKETGSILSLPFRQAAYWTRRAYMGISRSLTNQGYLKLHVKGHSMPWKLDHRHAWALNEGETIDKLVKIKHA